MLYIHVIAYLLAILAVAYLEDRVLGLPIWEVWKEITEKWQNSYSAVTLSS